MSWKLQRRAAQKVWRRALPSRSFSGQETESPEYVSYLTKLSSPAGGRSGSYDLTAAAPRSIRVIDNISAEHVTTIFGSARPSSTARFASSSSSNT